MPTISSNIDALSISSRKRDILVLESLFSLLAILDIGPSDIPMRDASLFISKRVITE